MIKVSIDPDFCTGHGRCYTLAPDVYEPDDEGYSRLRLEVIEDQALIEAARSGGLACPERAITVEETPGS